MNESKTDVIIFTSPDIELMGSKKKTAFFKLKKQFSCTRLSFPNYTLKTLKEMFRSSNKGFIKNYIYRKLYAIHFDSFYLFPIFPFKSAFFLLNLLNSPSGEAEAGNRLYQISTFLYHYCCLFCHFSCNVEFKPPTSSLWVSKKGIFLVYNKRPFFHPIDLYLATFRRIKVCKLFFWRIYDGKNLYGRNLSCLY